MPNQRIEVIVKEINYWKTHKLLPDVYCDFLLALYTEGEDTTEITTNNYIHTQKALAPILQLLIQMVVLLLSIIVINFEQVNTIFTIVFLGLSVLITFWMFKKQNKQYGIYFHLSMIILLVFVLLTAVYISNLYVTNQWIIHSIIALNFVCWFFVGRKLHLKYLLVISVLAFVFICIFAFF